MRCVKRQLILSILLSAIIMAGGAVIRAGTPALNWLAPQKAWAIATEEELLEEEHQAEAAERARHEEAARMAAERQAEARWAAEELRQRIAAAKPQMVYIQGGTFQMGDSFDNLSKDNYYAWSALAKSRPVHSVTLPGFYIGRYEVTFAEYDAFCDATDREKPVDPGRGRGTRPVVQVSWFDAVEYCNWRSRQDGLQEVYTIDGQQVNFSLSANGYRLPTEAEWEYAAKGGRSRGFMYSGSNDCRTVAWYNSDGAVDINRHPSHSVGEKLPNELGLYDMSGNVDEWCWDWYDDKYYQYSSGNNPSGPEGGTQRVLRGGSSLSTADWLLVNMRQSTKPSLKWNSTGFRLARTEQSH